MKKKLSIIFAFMVFTMCTAFTFHAYAEEVTDVTEEIPATPIVITNENAVLTLNADTFTYNASEIKPIPTVVYTDENGSKLTLTKDLDYNVTYSNNINAGTGTVKIEFKDEYTGTLSKKFTIKPVSIAGKTFSSSLAYTNAAYTGKEIKPAVKVSWNNNGKTVQLINNTDYTVKYSANKNIGKATVTISGKKNFNGTIKKTFNIVPQQVKGVKCTAKTTNSITLSWNKVTNISGYQILMYDKAKKAYVQVKRVPANQTSFKVTGLNTPEAYCFRIRAYKLLSDGKTNYYGAYHGYTTTATIPTQVNCTSVTKSGTTINLIWQTVRGSGYQIAYSTDKNFKNNVKYISVAGSSKSSYSIKNVNKNSTYYVKIRAYYTYNKTSYYGAFNTALSTYFSHLYSTYTSYYDEKNVNRTTNLKIASKAISGTIVQPGKTFSFNKVVGPRTTKKGYKTASVFNGSGSGIGGGICQVASTMFNCTLNANVSILERHQHSARVGYVPNGRDAAIYGTAQDFKWKNTTKYPIRVEMTVKDGKITCSFYTNVKAAPPKVSLKVTQKGKVFTLKRTVGKKVNYTTTSKY